MQCFPLSQAFGLARTFGLGALIVMLAGPALATDRIVAFGTSFTNGHGVSRSETYPAQLEAMLRAKGYDVSVDNEGRDGDTAAEGLSRVNSVVPNGTKIALVEFGVNEVCANCSGRKFTDEERQQLVPTLRAITQNLTSRGIKVVLLSIRGEKVGGAAVGGARTVGFGDTGIKDGKYALGDSMGHVNGMGYTLVANKLLPIVTSMLGRK